jgi:hypothetical protein
MVYHNEGMKYCAVERDTARNRQHYETVTRRIQRSLEETASIPGL